MALSVFNPQTLENRPATAEEIAAHTTEPSDVPPTSGTPIERLEEPAPASPARKNGSTNIVLDWETHLYDFHTGQVLPIHTPLSQQLEEFKQHLLGEVATLRARIDTLAAQPQQLERQESHLDTSPNP